MLSKPKLLKLDGGERSWATWSVTVRVRLGSSCGQGHQGRGETVLRRNVFEQSTEVGGALILELTDGDFAAVGLDITAQATPALPPGPGIGSGERAVRIPRQVMVAARAELPAA